MYSEDEPGSGTTLSKEHHVKRRRLHGACDICRRKKIKCNSAEMPNKICSNCIAYNLECTHNIPRHASKKETEKGYIQALEERLDKMEQLLRNVRPELDIEQSVAAANSPESVHSASTPPSHHSLSHGTPVPEFSYPTIQSVPDSVTSKPSPTVASNGSSDEEDLAHIALSEQLSRLAVDTVEDRFFGKSSGFMLMRDATNIKQGITGQQGGPTGRSLRRPLFWDLRAWEIEYVNSDLPQFVFPQKDLLDRLVSLYFERNNIYAPLLHRPTFERDLSNDLHLHDVGFGQVVLMVCALASRSIDDPRVILQGDKTGLSAGWKYFRQTRLMRNKLLDKASLYDLQYFCLVIPFLLASSLPQAAWNLVGLALRFSQEHGSHRRRGEGYRPTAIDELWKRCFWCLVSYDRLTSSFVGRSCAIHDEDFDADLPIECDDEYWECEDADLSWKQPPGKPSKVTAFVVHLRLCEILAFTLRTLYSTKKSKILTGLIGDQWEQRVVAELDSSMNGWKDSLPDHLRWDPNQENTTFLHQAASLHATFYYLQIQIHRPFIQKSTDLSFPSLAICTNAARACSHLIDAKGPGWIYPYPNIFIATFASGIVLLLHAYGGRRAGLNTDLDKELKDIQRCIDSLRVMEKRKVNSWHVAGRLLDVLTEIVTVHDGRPPENKFVSNKRPRDDSGQQEQIKGQTSPISSRPKFRPGPQPKAWPPTPPQLSRKPTPKEFDRNFTLPSLPAGPTLPPTTPQTRFSPTLSNYPSEISTSQSQHLEPAPVGADWDLSSFLLAQMNYMQPSAIPQSMDSMQQPPGHPSTSTSVLGSSADPMPFNGSNGSTNISGAFFNGKQQSTGSISPFMSSQPIGINQDMATLWSDAPNSFTIEEWDQFVATMGGPGNSSWDFQGADAGPSRGTY